MKEFVDTDVLVEILRGSSQALQWIGKSSKKGCLVPAIGAMELIEGCENKTDLAAVSLLLEGFDLYWPNEQIFQTAFALFWELKLATGIGLSDCVIAASALEEDGILFTFNKKHFRHVPNLRFEEPYSRTEKD